MVKEVDTKTNQQKNLKIIIEKVASLRNSSYLKVY
jgi:hypothetical protein